MPRADARLLAIDELISRCGMCVNGGFGGCARYGEFSMALGGGGGRAGGVIFGSDGTSAIGWVFWNLRS